MFYYNKSSLLIQEADIGVTKGTYLGQNNDLDSFIFFFPVKYHYVGKLLKEGEQPTVYSDDEEKDVQEAKKE